jgi:quercetin dioxygenase-like cupin family protein
MNQLKSEQRAKTRSACNLTLNRLGAFERESHNQSIASSSRFSERNTVGFIDLDQYEPISPVPGCRMRTPFGQNLMLSYLEMDDGAEVPLHHHPHEQGGILISGRVQLTIGDETRIVEAGSLFLIPPNVPHRAVAVDGPAKVLDVFSPIREDYAQLANHYIPKSETKLA